MPIAPLDAPPGPTFDALGVDDDILALLQRRGIEHAFPIQAATVPPALAGRDVTGQAPTGSGKTLAFGLPMVARTTTAAPRRPKALVLAPTRELAAQIVAELSPIGALRGLRFQSFYGGVGFEQQLRALRRGVDVAVACPGRLADLVSQRAVDLGDVELVVVDEADRMADMGFLPEVRRLLDATSPKRQTLLFSATLDGDVDVLVRRYQHDPVRHQVTPPARGPVDHELWLVDDKDRTERSAELLARSGPSIVFTRTRHGADRLAKRLERAGVPAATLHGGRSQGQRDRALEAFRHGEVRALVATDVAARGVHVEGVACVLHYDMPAEAKDYVHRSGRTGRAGAGGLVISLAVPAQRREADALLRRADASPLVTRRSDEIASHLAGLTVVPSNRVERVRTAPVPLDEPRPARRARPTHGDTGSGAPGATRGRGPRRSGRPGRPGQPGRRTQANASDGRGASTSSRPTRSAGPPRGRDRRDAARPGRRGPAAP